MNRTKLPIRKRLGDVPQFSRSTDAAIAEMPRRFFRDSQGRVPVPSVSGSSEVTFVMSMWTRIQPTYTANMWNEAINKRHGTEVIFAGDLQIGSLPLTFHGHDLIIDSEWQAEDPDSEAFKLHLPKLDDYLWLAEDGMKMKAWLAHWKHYVANHMVQKVR
ncbi:hypothetical protein AgCh_027837 [Apium graveolens]